MAQRKRARRFSVGLTLVKEIRLTLFGLAHGTSKTGVAEQILDRAMSNNFDWKEVQRELKQEAALRGISLEELVKQRLKEDGFGKVINLDEVDLLAIFDEDICSEKDANANPNP